MIGSNVWPLSPFYSLLMLWLYSRSANPHVRSGSLLGYPKYNIEREGGTDSDTRRKTKYIKGCEIILSNPVNFCEHC